MGESSKRDMDERSYRNPARMRTHLLTACLAASFVFSGVQASGAGKYMAHAGCFVAGDGQGQLDLTYQTLNPSLGRTVDVCVNHCRNLFYKVAGLQRGDCSCGSMFGQFGPAICKILCSDNRNQTCGDEGANSVYFTGHNAPGPVSGVTSSTPKSLNREDNLHLKWESPEIRNGKITGYKIGLENAVTSYSQTPFRTRTWDIDGSVTEADLTGVNPGVEYNISVIAVNEFGPGPAVFANVWSPVGTPMTPPFPKLVAKSKGQLTVALSGIQPTGGPISAYQIVVIDESSPVIFKPELLGDYESADSEGTPYYIAAEIPGVYLPEKFVIGDNRRYGKYWNKPLPDGRDFHVILGALSTLNGETKSAYGRPGHEQHEEFHADGHDHHHDHDFGAHDGEDEDYEEEEVEKTGLSFLSGKWTPLTIALAAAIIIFGTVLLLAVVVYFMMRRRITLRRARRRNSAGVGMGALSTTNGRGSKLRRSDQQELTVSASQLVGSTEPMDAAYVSSVFLVEEDGLEAAGVGVRGVEKYEKLKRKVWNIPPTAINIHPEVLGKGKFGMVNQASLIKKGLNFDGAVHSLEDLRMSESQKVSMLQDLDLCCRMGSHVNLVHLIGICEEPERIHVVVEYFPISLKQYLLESRNCDRAAGYRDRSLPVSSAGAAHLLEVAVGIAMGMSHLSSMQITHRQLCAKNISLVERSVPKIGGISYSNYNSLAQAPDYTRWLPQEALKSSQYAFFPPKGDVWSFGVVLWEIATLGATPYAEMRSNDELMLRVVKGARLPQTATIEDELYRLMTACWESETADRPTFHSLQAQLRGMAQQKNLPQINVSHVGQDFDYHPYSPELEHASL